MSLHCLSNVLISLIQIISLINECQYPFSIFCSSIRPAVGVQYVKIIVCEYFNWVFRLLSNFTYLGFSICRLAKIGDHHCRFTMFVYELDMKKYMAFSLLISAGLSVCKALQFSVNIEFPEFAYPTPFIQSPKTWIWDSEKSFIAIFVMNILSNFINYFVFVFVHLIVDLVLVRKLWLVIREKEEKLNEMKRSEKEMEKTKKENDESKRRAVFMVVLNSTLNFCSKIPLLIPALADFRHLIFTSSNSVNESVGTVMTQNVLKAFGSSLNFKFYCASQKSCIIFESFGNLLFLVSFSATLFFLKHFDMNFKQAYQQTVSFACSSKTQMKK